MQSTPDPEAPTAVWWVSEEDAIFPGDDDLDRFLGAFSTAAAANAYAAERRRETGGSRTVHVDRYEVGIVDGWNSDFFQVDA